MTLKEKFKEILISFWTSEWENECIKVADEFAIGFSDWCKQEYELEDTSFHNKCRDVNGEYRE